MCVSHISAVGLLTVLGLCRLSRTARVSEAELKLGASPWKRAIIGDINNSRWIIFIIEQACKQAEAPRSSFWSLLLATSVGGRTTLCKQNVQATNYRTLLTIKMGHVNGEGCRYFQYSYFFFFFFLHLGLNQIVGLLLPVFKKCSLEK